MSAALRWAAAFGERPERGALRCRALREATQVFYEIARSPLEEGENIRALAEVIAAAVEAGRAEIKEEAFAEARAAAVGALDSAARLTAKGFEEARIAAQRLTGGGS